MKKSLLATIVVLAFVVYSYHQRHNDAPPVVTTTQVANKSANSGAPTQSAPNAPSSSVTGPVAYKDGSYTGSAADAYYGFIQVQATVSGGKLTDVVFLQYPNDRDDSRRINAQAMPFLKQEALQAQKAQVDSITGATDTSQAFVQSLSVALKAAQV